MYYIAINNNTMKEDNKIWLIGYIKGLKESFNNDKRKTPIYIYPGQIAEIINEPINICNEYMRSLKELKEHKTIHHFGTFEIL